MCSWSVPRQHQGEARLRPCSSSSSLFFLTPFLFLFWLLPYPKGIQNIFGLLNGHKTGDKWIKTNHLTTPPTLTPLFFLCLPISGRPTIKVPVDRQSNFPLFGKFQLNSFFFSFLINCFNCFNGQPIFINTYIHIFINCKLKLNYSSFKFATSKLIFFQFTPITFLV